MVFKEVFSANLNIEFWCKTHDFTIISCYFLPEFIDIESCTSWLYKLSSRSRSIERLESCPATLDCWKLVQLYFQVHFYSFLPFLEPYQGPMLLFIDLYDWVFKAEDLFLNFDKKVPTKPGKVWRWKVETFSSCNVSDCLIIILISFVLMDRKTLSLIIIIYKVFDSPKYEASVLFC